ncbi:phytoene/squalene synthase family protein [Roseomonas haemaphysalidis]|uniref:Squalene/phytoene synthase family protein n=1 Tax=Roseomonas haemaphysalidis TaxID=2768162 RepID=A0ABS3KSK4_9PROT|nr:squalene/phytoene synthase family protein [Roseomonas haemaphysalidis]MBO1080445.1 squalene/phytoene synthase family protein [Roseomonas haemaphysalidis]
MPDPAPLSELAASLRRNDPDRFLCALFAPPAQRETLFLLSAFDHELAWARAVTSTVMTGLIRLQWWRDVVEEAAGDAPPRQHEVAAPLCSAIREGRLNADALLPMIDAREAEVEEEMPSADALWAFLRGTGGGHAVAAGQVLGAPANLVPALQAVGACSGMARMLRGIGPAAAQGRTLLPADLLGQHGLTPEDVVRDPSASGVTAVAQVLAQDALTRLRQARRDLSGLPRQAVAAVLPGRLAERDLRRVLARGWSPAAPPPPRGVADRLAVMWGGWRGV